MPTRREILQHSAALAAAAATGAAAQAQTAPAPAWDSGEVVHLLPTVSADRILIKASFKTPLTSAPTLAAGDRAVTGLRTDSAGETWSFDVGGLKPDTAHRLALTTGGKALCAPWELKTFPAPDAAPQKLRLLVFTCAGGHDALTPINGITRFLEMSARRKLLERGLSFQPDAVIANGDHVYWDIGASRASKRLGLSPEGLAYAGRFDSKLPVTGTKNEAFLKKAAGPQITPLYGALCRSTPVFFLQDDHDYFDNDEADDTAITFPPNHWMLDLARSTQHMYFPEFLPDANRPAGLPGASAADRPAGVSESFGTLRYGKLAELMLYDVRRSATLAGPSAVFVDPDVEDWLVSRMKASDTTHVVHVPSNPPGWSAGKWGEWYPDIADSNGKLTLEKPKPYWQTGWLKQHDRLLSAASAMKGRIPLVLSGDLHATAEGRIRKSGAASFEANPVHVVLSGTLGTGDGGWPSAFRGAGAQVSRVLEMDETLAPIEENGFSIVDFTPDEITIRFFKWKYRRDSVEAIDKLEPFRTTVLKRA